MDILCDLYGKTLLHYCSVGERCVGGTVSRLCVVSGIFNNRLRGVFMLQFSKGFSLYC